MKVGFSEKIKMYINAIENEKVFDELSYETLGLKAKDFFIFHDLPSGTQDYRLKLKAIDLFVVFYFCFYIYLGFYLVGFLFLLFF